MRASEGIERWMESIPREAHEDVRSALKRRRFHSDELIVREGEPGDSLWIVEDGRAAVEATAYDGSISTLNVLGPGDIFGELALITDAGRRTASVRALDAVTALALARGEFTALRERYPSVDRFVVELLTDHIVRLTRLLDDAYTRDVEQRVLRRLFALAGGEGAVAPVTVPVDQATLGALAGASRQTANRILRSAAGEGWLSIGRRRIEILDVARLRDRAEATRRVTES